MEPQFAQRRNARGDFLRVAVFPRQFKAFRSVTQRLVEPREVVRGDASHAMGEI
jgi:hypothetical protein